jgi:hypothetical protein
MTGVDPVARSVWSSFDGSQDELVRLARLESDTVRRAAAHLAGSGEKASVALPMAGISLLAPLGIHLGIWSLTQGTELGGSRWLEGFDWWIGVSLMLVGVAHATLAILCCVFAGKVSRASLVFLKSKSPMSGWGVLGWTVLASCLPGLIAFAIPVVVVLVTGLLFIPWMFGSMHRTVVDERIALAAD